MKSLYNVFFYTFSYFCIGIILIYFYEVSFTRYLSPGAIFFFLFFNTKKERYFYELIFLSSVHDVLNISPLGYSFVIIIIIKIIMDKYLLNLSNKFVQLFLFLVLFFTSQVLVNMVLIHVFVLNITEYFKLLFINFILLSCYEIYRQIRVLHGL